jgi:hypothetical protein
MIDCPSCGAQNPDGEVYCYKCGILLNQAFDTKQLPEDEAKLVFPKRHWGTATFDYKTYVLMHVRGHDKPLAVPFEGEELVIGRSNEEAKVDIDLSDYGALEQGVSRRHALLRRQNETVQLIDLQSANSTFLNGHKIIPNEPRILRDGDEMKLGQLVVRVAFEDVHPS